MVVYSHGLGPVRAVSGGGVGVGGLLGDGRGVGGEVRRKLSTEEYHKIRQAVKAFQASGLDKTVTTSTADGAATSMPGSGGSSRESGSRQRDRDLLGNRDYVRAQVSKIVRLVLHRTESSSVEEFLSRYEEGQQLAATLSGQQVKLDSRLTQLRGEHAELLAQLSDMSFLVADRQKTAVVGDATSGSGGGGGLKDARAASADGMEDLPSVVGGSGSKKKRKGEDDDESLSVGGGLGESGKKIKAESAGRPGSSESAGGAAAAADGEDGSGSEEGDEAGAAAAGDDFANTDRYLDNKLFNAEVRMNQFMRLFERAIITISEVRTAVGHLVNLLSINDKLLVALPRSAPPAISSNEDIQASLTWFEDRIMQLSEALTMDANRPTGGAVTDDSKPLSERQIDLAMLIHDMQKSNFHRKLRLSHHQKVTCGNVHVVVSSSVLKLRHSE